ncbi:MAG TPA: hypothetical protein VEO00_06445 [Actinomycetota bacterium]|nr:hypothetical protein [Actinomycetota bacterium]
MDHATPNSIVLDSPGASDGGSNPPAAGTFTNLGTVTKQNGTALTSILIPTDNQGTFTVSAGDTEFSSVTNETAGDVSLADGTTASVDTTFANSGQVTLPEARR